jgi:NitT/TauT family transport system ATP-binding protein
MKIGMRHKAKGMSGVDLDYEAQPKIPGSIPHPTSHFLIERRQPVVDTSAFSLLPSAYNGVTKMRQTIIEMNDVSLAYTAAEYPEVSRISLGIREGELVSLVGPSGCGKSTLLRLIAGSLSPTSGKVAVSGNPELSGWSQLSFVPQDSLLLPWRTVLGNVRLPLELQRPPQPEAKMDEKALRALELVNLSGVEIKYPQELSGGMRQRVALARALVEQAQILLLDEPFAALDDLTRSQLHLELLRIRAQTGITVLMVTHNIFEAVFLSDRVIVMGEKPGRILGEIAIVLPERRNLKLLGIPEFGAYVGRVQDLLETGWGDYNGR